MNDGRIAQPGRQEEPHHKAHPQRQQDAGEGESRHRLVGIADHQFGHKRRKAGGKQHLVGVIPDFFLPYHRMEYHTQHRGPHIQNIDAPGAKAGGQDGGQGRRVIRLFSGDAVQRRTDIADQGHIQKRGRKAADRKAIGRAFGRLTDDLQKAGQHLRPVRHKKCRNQKTAAEKQKKDS